MNVRCRHGANKHQEWSYSLLLLRDSGIKCAALPRSEAEVLLFAFDVSDGPARWCGAGNCWAGAGGDPLPKIDNPVKLINDSGGKELESIGIRGVHRAATFPGLAAPFAGLLPPSPMVLMLLRKLSLLLLILLVWVMVGYGGKYGCGGIEFCG